tara:strand:+ start:11275 stop:12099 length:825 start_codon:yes stop_codon:yes gene_type:complete
MRKHPFFRLINTPAMESYAIHASSRIKWQAKLALIIKEGLAKHGVNAVITDNRDKVSDTSLILGPNVWKKVEAKGNYIMFNRKFLGFNAEDVHENVAISWDGFNGRGTFCVSDLDENRLARYVKDEEILDYKENMGGINLLCEQHDLGRSTDWKNINEFYDYIYERYRNVAVRKKISPENVGVETWKQQILKELEDVKTAHILNSTVSAELTIFGIHVASHDIGDPCYALKGKEDKRMELLTYLAHCQWHYSEINNGEWWDKLKKKVGPQLHEI